MKISLDQHHEFASLMEYTTDGEVKDRWLEVCSATNFWPSDVGLNVHSPEYAPLGLGMLFDDWQEDYVDALAERYKRYQERASK